MNEFDESGSSQSMGGDVVNQIAQAIQVVAAAVDTLNEQVEGLSTQLAEARSDLAELRGTVMDDIIGSIKTTYDGIQKKNSIEQLRNRFGERISPFNDFLSEIEPGKDFFEMLNDQVSARRAAGDYSDDDLDNDVGGIVNMLLEKANKLKSIALPEMPAAAKDGEVLAEPQGVTIKKVSVSAAPADGESVDPEEDEIKKLVQSMKEKNKNNGMASREIA